MPAEKIIDINGEYLYGYIKKYVEENNTSFAQISRNMGRGTTHIHNLCRLGKIKPIDMRFLIMVYGVDETQLKKNPHGYIVSQQTRNIEKDKSSEKLSDTLLASLSRSILTTENKVTWQGERVSKIPDMYKELLRIETKLDFLINELVGNDKDAEIKQMLENNSYWYQGNLTPRYIGNRNSYTKAK